MIFSCAHAIHHAAHRKTFGRLLIEQPLMQNVLADLAIESEAATILALRVARACDRANDSEHEALMKRIGTAIAKYWTTKRAPVHAAEALECLGGNGYVEESIMPRLYREAPLNSIWEESGNVNCLDTLRAMSREPRTVEAFFAEVAHAKGIDKRLDTAVERLQHEFADLQEIEIGARRLVEQMALVLQGALLVQYGHPAVADAFCASRLAGNWGRAFGTLPPGVNVTTIVERARSKV